MESREQNAYIRLALGILREINRGRLTSTVPKVGHRTDIYICVRHKKEERTEHNGSHFFEEVINLLLRIIRHHLHEYID